MKQESDCKEEQRLARNRKFSKPMMERRRRARINDSLNELKSLVLSAMEKDPSRYNKMEKADILEITVNFLRGFCATEKSEVDHRAQFCAGYNECSREIQSYLLMATDVTPQVKATMLSRITMANPATAHDKNIRQRIAEAASPNSAAYSSVSSNEPTSVYGSVHPHPTSSVLTGAPGIAPSQPCLRFTYPSPPASPMSGPSSPSSLSSSSSAFNDVSTNSKRKASMSDDTHAQFKRYRSDSESSGIESSVDSKSPGMLWRPW